MVLFRWDFPLCFPRTWSCTAGDRRKLNTIVLQHVYLFICKIRWSIIMIYYKPCFPSSFLFTPISRMKQKLKHMAPGCCVQICLWYSKSTCCQITLYFIKWNDCFPWLMKFVSSQSDCRNEFDPSYKVLEGLATVGSYRKSSMTDGRSSITRAVVRKLLGAVPGRNQNKHLSFGLFLLESSKGCFCEGQTQSRSLSQPSAHYPSFLPLFFCKWRRPDKIQIEWITLKPLEIFFIMSLTSKDTQNEECSFTHFHTCREAVLLLPLKDRPWILFWAPFCVKARFHLLLKGQRRVEYREAFNVGIKRFAAKPSSHDCSLWSTAESRICGSGLVKDILKTKES